VFTVTSALAGARSLEARTVPPDCSVSSPCHLQAGTYQLGSWAVLPDLQFTVPSGWSSGEDSTGELKLFPTSHPNEILDVWLDMRAVKSSGEGHGTTVLPTVGKTAGDLIRWLTTDRDFQTVSQPTGTTIGNQIKATTIAIGVSTHANYGDPGCPANPRCADLFRNPLTWQPGDWFGIGGTEQVRLYLAPIKSNSTIPHTLEIALDAPTHTRLQHLTSQVRHIIPTIRLPEGSTAG
jgi:hypothetical protein